MRILVADNDPDTADSLATLLRLWRYDVNVARDGKAALDIAAQYPPDIALLELRTPVDGEIVASTLRGRDGLRRLRIVAITGASDEQIQLARSSHVFDVVLPKPCDSQFLKGLLAELAR
jgi:CheY-like chemotaxis protein